MLKNCKMLKKVVFVVVLGSYIFAMPNVQISAKEAKGKKVDSNDSRTVISKPKPNESKKPQIRTKGGSIEAGIRGLATVNDPKEQSANPLTPKEIYQKYSKAVVLIIASKEGKSGSSMGTGSIITVKGEKGAENMILTNAHVIFDDEENKPLPDISVYLKPDKIVGSWKDDLKNSKKAVPVVYNRPLDLALLKVEGDISSSSIQLADSNNVEVGDSVIAIGHPEQGGLWTLTAGTISSQKARIDNVEGKDVFQTDASINRGNSGGPLIDTYGGLVGVNTCIARRAADGLAITGINFSLKASAVEKWMIKGGYSTVRLEIKEEEKAKEIEKSQPKDFPVPPIEHHTEKKKEEPQKTEHKGDEMKPEQKKEPAAPTQTPDRSIQGQGMGTSKQGGEQKEKEGVILTEKRPYKFDDLIDYLMDAKEKEMDKKMDDMWNKF